MMKRILLIVSLFFTFYASSQVITPFAPRISVTQKGGIVFLSNTSSKANPTNIVQNEMPIAGTGYNNNYSNAYVDIDSDPTTWMSSSDQLNLPNCTEITWAGLYWGADCQAGDENFATRTQVKLKVNNGTYTNLVADYLKDNTVGYKTYHCFKDVTSIVAAAPLNASFTIANMAGDIGGTNLFGGWTIVIVYKNNNLNTRNLTVFDGLASVSAGTYSTVDIPISGFQTPLAGPVTFDLGLVGYDGDRSLTGDQLLFKGGATFINISDGIHPVADIFNSTISRSGVITSSRNPAYNNTLGYDANIFTPNNATKNYIGNNAVSGVIRQTSGGETFLTQVVTSAIDVYEPDLRSIVKVKNISNPGSTIANPGDIMEYTVKCTNVGSDPSNQTYILDSIEGNANYIPGSISVVYGPNVGPKTDALGDDQAEYIAASRAIKIRIGTGANGFVGGVLNNSPLGTDSTVVKFRVQVTTDCVYLFCDNYIDNSCHIIGTGNVSGNLFDNTSSPGLFDVNGCPFTGATVSVVNTNICADPVASANTPICAGSTLNLNVTHSNTATYAWTGPNGFTSSLQNPSIPNVNASHSGTYTVHIYFTGTNCDIILPVNVQIKAADAGPDQTSTSTCGLTTVTLAGNTPAGSTGQWTILSGTGGGFGSGNTATSTVANSTFNGIAGNTYVLRWALTVPGCPASTDNVTITFQNASSVATLVATNVTCANTLKVNITGGVSPYTININNGVGTITGYTSGTSIPVNPAATTAYTLTSVVGANGCPVTSITGNPATITVNTAITTGTVTAVTAGTVPVTVTAGPKFAGTAVSGTGTGAWTNPGNATTSNNSFATFGTSGALSPFLNATNFGFSIPSDAVVQGIVLEVQRKKSSSSNGRDVKDNSVILYGGTGTSQNKASNTSWPKTLGYRTYGTATDLWGMTWTPAQINSASFGAGLRAQLSSNPTASVDAFRITVYYTSPSMNAYCDNASSVVFSATGFSNVTTYTWTPPTGASIVSGQGTSSVTIDLNGAGQVGNYSVVVTPYNACGAGTPASITIPIVDCANPTTNLCLKGNVYWDLNGSVTPGLVDGTPINNVNGTQLYVTVNRTSGGSTNAIATVPVTAAGTWQVCNSSIIGNVQYRVTLSSINYLAGTLNALILPTYPLGSSSNGEINNNVANTLTGNDGTNDGRITFNTSNPMTNNETNLNFGLKINTPPVANANSSTTNEDTPITFNVTGNDTDIDGTVTISSVVLSTTSSNGTWSVNTLGNVTYTPAANFTGTASITYTVKDNDNLTSNAGTITVTVLPINDAPVATASTVSTPENTTYSFVSTNFNYTDIESNPLTSITIGSLPAAGTLLYNGNVVSVGQVIAVADIVNLTFSPEESQYGSPYTTFTFTANDANNGTVAGTMTINVTHITSGPNAVDNTLTTNQNTAVSLNILTNDTNIDGTITASSVDLDPYTAGQQTTLTIPGQGTFTVNTSGVLTFTPVASFYGTTAEVYYTVKNSLGLTSNIATIIVVVSPVGAPVAVNNTATTNINAAVTFNVTSNDYDTDGGTINVSRVDFAPTTPGYQQSLYVDGKGTFYVDLLGNVTFTPDWNFEGTASTIYTVKDNSNFTSNIATITVTVVWSNLPPIAVNNTMVTNEDVPVSINVATNDYDLDVTHGNAGVIDVASVDLNPTMPGIQTTYTVVGQGTFTVNNTGVVTFTPVLNFFGTVTPIGYRIKDLAGAVSDSALIEVTVNPVNDAPIAVNDAEFGVQTTTYSSVTFSISSNDYDVDGTLNLASLDINPYLAGRQTTYTNSDGVYTVDNLGNLTFTYSFAAPVGVLTPVNYIVFDNLGIVSNNGLITITLLPIGTPLAIDDNLTTFEDTPVTFDISLNDQDLIGTNPGVEPNSIVFLSATATAAGTWSYADTANIPGHIIFTPTLNFNGTATINYTIRDIDGNLSNPATITVTIAPINDAPSFVKGANQLVFANSGVHIVSFWATAMSEGPADEVSQLLTFELTNNNNALFSSQPYVDENGHLSYALAPNQTGIAVVTINIADNGGTANGGIDRSMAQTFTIMVNPPAVPLPVTLTKFYAECSGSNVVLNWETASEQNSDYFIIEKSDDFISWKELTKVNSHGNSNVAINYAWVDKSFDSRVNYYRLSQVDFNGVKKVFDPISSDCSKNAFSFNIFPNPTSATITLVLPTDLKGDEYLEIQDLSGKKLMTKKIEKLTQTAVDLNVNQLATGLYTVCLKRDKETIHTEKFVKK